MSVELIIGCMFSGKSELAISRARRAKYAKQKVQVFKPAIDTRRGVDLITSHNGNRIEAVPVTNSDEWEKELLSDTEVVVTDEVQFLDCGIVKVTKRASARGVRVIHAGLKNDFKGDFFGPMPQLLEIADRVDTCTAICVVCGDEATRTQRIVNGKPAKPDDPVVVIGAEEAYEARCPDDHVLTIDGDHGEMIIRVDEWRVKNP